MRPRIFFIYLLISFSFFLSNALLAAKDEIETSVLKPVRVLPARENENVYFRYLPFLAVDDRKNFYAVNYIKHIVFKVDINGRYLQTIGRIGQGPGDLYFPTCLTCWDGKIIVVDRNAISIFNELGNILNRFRVFLYIEDVEATDKYIFTLTPGRDKLIHVFDYSGKMIANFGQKFKVDFSIHKTVKDIANGIIYRSNIAVSEKYVFLVFSALGEIHKYDLAGNFIEKKTIDFFDKDISKVRDENRSQIFKKGLVVTQSGRSVVQLELIDSICYLEGKLYILLNVKSVEKIYGEIYRIDANSLETEKKYIFYNILDKNARMNNRDIVVKNLDNIVYFFTSVSDYTVSGDIVCALYKYDSNTSKK